MNPKVFKWIFDLVENDPDYNLRFDFIFIFIAEKELVFRRKIVQHLCRHSPFWQNQTSPLNLPSTANRLWFLLT